MGLVLRLAFISVPWQVLWCSWANISVFLLMRSDYFDSYGGGVFSGVAGCRVV